MLQEKHQAVQNHGTKSSSSASHGTQFQPLKTPQAIPFSPTSALKPINNKATIGKLVSPQPLLLVVLSLINSQNSYRQQQAQEQQ